MSVRDRGTFLLHENDKHLFPRQVPDAAGYGGRYFSCSKNYILSELGRLNTFPKYSLPYSKCTIEDLARYGFFWGHDGTRCGYVRCAYCNLTIEDYEDGFLAFHEHLFRQPLCPLLTGNAINVVSAANVSSEKTSREAVTPDMNEDRHTAHYFKIHPVLKTTKINYYPMREENSIVDFGRKCEEERKLEFLNTEFFKTSDVSCDDLSCYNFIPLDKVTVGCKTCGLEIKNLQHGDLAAVVHYTLSPMCTFFAKSFSPNLQMPAVIMISPTFH